MNEVRNVCLNKNPEEIIGIEGSPADTIAEMTETSVAPKQWYLTAPDLQCAEIQSMLGFKPDTKYGYLPNGGMYWNIRLRPIVCGQRKDWSLLMVYHDKYPQCGEQESAIYIYPVKPNSGEMLELMNKSGITETSIPRTIKGSDAQIHLDVEPQRDTVVSAASYLRYAMHWITGFELGLMDQEAWSDFKAYNNVAQEPDLSLQSEGETVSVDQVAWTEEEAKREE